MQMMGNLTVCWRMLACMATYLVEEVTAVVQQSVQHQNCIKRQGFRQAQAVSKLLSSGQALRSTAQVLLVQLGTDFDVRKIGLESAQRGPGCAAVSSCALLILQETQVGLHGAASQAPACRQ